MRVLTFLFLSVAPIWACTCIGGDDPCLDLATPETAVFVGVVIRDSGEGDGAGPGRVRIEEALRGVPQGLGKAEISTMHGTSCYRRLALGDRYVFVMPRGQPYGVGGCARSFRLRGNEHKLEALRKAIRNGRESVTGSVRDGSFEPFAGARVELEPTTDGGKSYTAKSGRNGEYTFPKAAPGEYRLQARKRKLRTEVATVTVPARGCAIHDLRVNDDVHFRGRVKDRATGKPFADIPFADIKVALYRIDGSQKVATATTDEDGSYDFPPVPPGDYRVEVEREGQESGPGPLVSARDGEEFNHELRLPFRRKGAKLRVRFTDDAGNPAAGILLRVTNSRTGEGFSLESGELAEVTGDIFLDETYELWAARMVPGLSPVVSGSAVIPSAKAANDLTIVLRRVVP